MKVKNFILKFKHIRIINKSLIRNLNFKDSFVNSQEWTLSRSVPDLKLGIVGSVNSGKSSLVHRFLTGAYMPEESPEGGRFKKEVIIDGQSYLLLIRDEGGPPEMQFAHWCDAVIFVFSVENEDSFLMAHQFYLKMSNYRNMSDMPLMLVGTQDYVSETNPRVIDDVRAKSLAQELKKCSYYETSATYGFNVEKLFLEGLNFHLSYKILSKNLIKIIYYLKLIFQVLNMFFNYFL